MFSTEYDQTQLVHLSGKTRDTDVNSRNYLAYLGHQKKYLCGAGLISLKEAISVFSCLRRFIPYHKSMKVYLVVGSEPNETLIEEIYIDKIDPMDNEVVILTVSFIIRYIGATEYFQLRPVTVLKLFKIRHLYL